ncbi:MAG: cytochrome c family protein [Pseudomonadota bacterium]
MLDTMTFTKSASAICGALLVFLLGKWAAEVLFHVELHGEQSFVIEVEVAEEPAQQEAVDFATIMASADPEAGARVFRKCSACHKLAEGENGTGPSLYGVVGREKAAVAGFGYSDVLTTMGGEWTPENLSAFLEKPGDYAPGTSMGFAGLKKVEERADVIAYIDSVDN